MATRMTGREELMRQGLMGDPFTQALESINLRQDANNALNNASDQYEADVADFKNTQATEFEQGLASLMDRVGALENIPQPTIDTSQFLTAADLPTQPTYDDRGLRDRLDMLENQYTTGFDELNNMFTPIDTSQFLTAGDIPSFNIDDYRDDFLSIAREGIDIPEFEQPDLSGYARLDDIPTVDTSQFLTTGDLPSFDFNPDDYRDDFLSIAREGIDIPEFEQPDFSNFVTLDDLPTFDFDEGAFRDNLFEDILENIPQPPQTPQPPAFNEDELRESIYNDIIGDLPGLFEDFDFPVVGQPGVPGDTPFPGDIPPMVPPQSPPFDGFPPPNFPGGTPGFFDQFPGIIPPGSGNPYEGIFGPGQGFPMPPIDFPPFFPPVDGPPQDPPPPPPPPPPVDDTPTGPINPYTGQPVKNPYKPYSTDSGAAPLNRAITPRDFGTAPGFEPKKLVPAPPRKLPPKPPQVPPPRRLPSPGDNNPDLRFIAMPFQEPKDMKLGGGISMLPMNGQGDTLTTQVFQAGFRPRR